jgi:outer membrane protein OmpA-like peptidoglycan-associated protein
MGFNYDRNKHKQGEDTMWTSYSDLFLGLSIIFLLLYVAASLRQGTDGIRQHIENKRLAQEAADLRQQIQVYETLKQDYLAKQASQDEQATYEELMSKLSLLQDEAREEKSKLELQAHENEKKAQALNKYQQMIRNIINSNLLAKSRIKTRDTMIDSKEEIITEKSKEIDSLEKTVAQRQAEIEQGEQRIEGLQSELDRKVAQLRKAFNSQKITKAKFEQQQNALKAEAENRIAALRKRNARVQAELERASQDLKATATQLTQTQGTVEKLGQENSRLEGELESASGRHKAEMERLRGEFENAKGKERAAFEAAIAREKLSGAERAAREAAFKAEAEKKAKALAGQIAEADRKFRESQRALAKAQENLNAKKNLARQIKRNFASSGVKAEVDERSGDVLLSFGDEYFDTGAATLKPRMREIINKAMPAYSSSLFDDPKVAEKIQSVEIIGFASPTYRGKFVNPASLDPKDREAVNYNLDLSYNRARSIFNYVFDKEQVSFKHQERLLPLVKVTGRSFLSNDTNRDPAANTSAEEFCRKNDCAKLQRVIIKFTLRD